MQILHRFAGSIQRYAEELSDPDRYRHDHCPQREAPRPLRAHGFYTRTLVDIDFDGTIRVRRYLCCRCKRTVSLLPEFALLYLRFGIVVIALFLVARLLLGLTLKVAPESAKLTAMPYQRGQFSVRRFRQQAETLCGAHCPTGEEGGFNPPQSSCYKSRNMLQKQHASCEPSLCGRNNNVPIDCGIRRAKNDFNRRSSSCRVLRWQNQQYSYGHPGSGRRQNRERLGDSANRGIRFHAGLQL